MSSIQTTSDSDVQRRVPSIHSTVMAILEASECLAMDDAGDRDRLAAALVLALDIRANS